MIRQRHGHGLHLRERPSGDCRGTLLYIHGLGESGLCFEDLMSDPALDSWHHLSPDLPGYGKSAWTPEPLGLEEHATTLATWLGRRNAPPVVVVGHSMGGVVGLLLAERAPERVRGFINVEGNISSDDCSYSAKAAGYPEEEFLAHGWQTLLDDVYRDGLEDPALRCYYSSVRICDPRVYHRNSRELVEISAAEGLASRLAALAVPTVYLLGHPGGTGGRSRKLLSQAGVEWRSIEPAGHWPFLDQPGLFVREALSFLGRLSSPGD